MLQATFQRSMRGKVPILASFPPFLSRQAEGIVQQTRVCSNQPQWGSESDKARIAAEVEAQRRFFQNAANTMSFHYCRDLSSTRLVRWLRQCTIDVNFDFRRWRKHQQSTRHLNQWTLRNFINSDNVRRLVFPDLALIASTSSALCYYNVYVACQPTEVAGFYSITHHVQGGILTLPLECFFLTSMALGLLATFKTQMSYARFVEGRNLWIQVVHESCALASRILTRVPSHNGNQSATISHAREHAFKLLRTFPLTMKYHLTEDGCNPHIKIHQQMDHAELQSALMFALRAELQQIWNMHDETEYEFVRRLLAAEVFYRPLHVLHELSFIHASVFCHPSEGFLDSVAAAEIDRSIATLHHAFGGCEKILRTPIYTSYTRVLSRYIWFWCNSLPLALFPLVGPIATVPGSVIVAFFMFGIEDIGSRVEQPFDIMPLWQYCQTVDQYCVQLLRHHAALTHKQRPDDDYDFDSTDGFKFERLNSWADPLAYEDEEIW